MSAFEPRIPRHLAVRLGEEAVAISQAGRYVGPAGPAEIGAQVMASLKKTAYYGPDHTHGSPARGPHPTRFEVTNETTLSAHRRHQAKGHNVPDYNPRTLKVPIKYLNEQTPAMAQWWQFKSMNMDTILFFKVSLVWVLYSLVLSSHYIYR
jgi:hypothetical protein